MDKNDLTKRIKVGKLSKKELEIKNRALTGKIILVCNCYKGGISDIKEYNKVETITE
jgi:hypothetical protein